MPDKHFITYNTEKSGIFDFVFFACPRVKGSGRILVSSEDERENRRF